MVPGSSGWLQALHSRGSLELLTLLPPLPKYSDYGRAPPPHPCRWLVNTERTLKVLLLPRAKLVTHGCFPRVLLALARGNRAVLWEKGPGCCRAVLVCEAEVPALGDTVKGTQQKAICSDTAALASYTNLAFQHCFSKCGPGVSCFWDTSRLLELQFASKVSEPYWGEVSWPSRRWTFMV